MRARARSPGLSARGETSRGVVPDFEVHWGPCSARHARRCAQHRHSRGTEAFRDARRALVHAPGSADGDGVPSNSVRARLLAKRWPCAIHDGKHGPGPKIPYELP